MELLRVQIKIYTLQIPVKTEKEANASLPVYDLLQKPLIVPQLLHQFIIYAKQQERRRPLAYEQCFFVFSHQF